MKYEQILGEFVRKQRGSTRFKRAGKSPMVYSGGSARKEVGFSKGITRKADNDCFTSADLQSLGLTILNSNHIDLIRKYVS